MNKTSIALAICSGLCSSLAYLEYIRNIRKGETRPNGATWAIWSVIVLFSTSTYFFSTGDPWKCVIGFVNSVLCIGIFVYALVCRKFENLDITDWLALALGIISAIVWKLTSAAYANLIVQVAITIGFIPTWRMVWKDPSREEPRPWWLWTLAYALACIVVIMRWKHQVIDIIYPALCVVLHASVALVSELRMFHVIEELIEGPKLNRLYPKK